MPLLTVTSTFGLGRKSNYDVDSDVTYINFVPSFHLIMSVLSHAFTYATHSKNKLLIVDLLQMYILRVMIFS